MKISQKTLIFSLFIVVTFPVTVFPASLFLDNEKDIFGVDEQFQIDVFLNSENERVNAVEGQVIFPENLTEVVEIRSGNSSINFWIEKPTVSSNGTISFSGITPGGFLGNKEFLFSIIFKTKREGSGVLTPTKIKVLQNDGNGTEVKSKGTSYSFKVESNLGSGKTIRTIEDNFPPENFKPSVGRDTSMFEGKYFLVFATQDKESGVDHYEVKEGLFGDYTEALSPYLLTDQSLTSFIYVKALDNSGKEKVVKLFPQNKNLLAKYVILSIIILALGFLLKKIWPKSTQ